MRLSYIPTNTLPPKERGIERVEVDSKGYRLDGYSDLISAFTCDTVTFGRVVGYDPERITAESVVSGINGGLRRTGEVKDIHPTRRGDAVYLVRGRRSSVGAGEFEDILVSFVGSREGSRTLVFDTTNVNAAYKTLHYKRTRLGLGQVRIARDKDDPTLIHLSEDESPR